jgi:hypothetical protein
MEEPERRQHGQILGILLILYGCFQLFGTIFIGVIMWAATGGHFYYQILKTPLSLVGFGILLLILVLPFLVAYGLLEKTKWAKIGLLTMSVAGILLSFGLFVLPLQLHWSTNRVIATTLLGGTITSLCLYGIWIATRRAVR